MYYCSSGTSPSCWITHSTQCHRRGCNNIASFLHEPHRSHIFLWRLHTLWPPQHILVTAPFCCGRKSRGACAQSFALAASNNRDHAPQSIYYWLCMPHMYIIAFRAHPVHGESHIQPNATGEFATIRLWILKFENLFICHLWRNSNTRRECNRLDRNEVNVKDKH